MRRAPQVLFICTGNIFRSMTAEYALKAVLGAEAGAGVCSAGLEQPPHGVVDFVIDYMAKRGLDVTSHRPSLLTRRMLQQADLAVAMSTDHRHAVLQRYEIRLPLFSEVAYATEVPLADVREAVPDWAANRAAAIAHGTRVMDYIFDGAPHLVARIPLSLKPARE